MTKNNKKDEGIVSSKEKEEFVADMKKTIKDMGKIPGIIFAPVIGYVAKKYEKIPTSRRKKLEEIVASIKKNGKSSLKSLRKWFFERGKDVKEQAKEKFDDKAKAPTQAAKKKAKKKVEEAKKAAKKKTEKAKKQAEKAKKKAKKQAKETTTAKNTDISKTELKERKKFLEYQDALDGRRGNERIVKESDKRGFKKDHE